MKRLLITCLAVSTLCTVSTFAQAQCIDARTQEILRLTPVSTHYVQKIIERTNAALTSAPSSAGSTFSDGLFNIFWAWFAQSAVNSTTSSSTDDSFQSTRLASTSACMHIDLLVLEAQREKVRCILNDALADKDGHKILLAKYILLFLQERYATLIQGGTNPLLIDSNWSKINFFDPIPTGNVVCKMPSEFVLKAPHCRNCCERTSYQTCKDQLGTAYLPDFGLQTCVSEGGILPPGSTEKPKGLCPFTSNYLPPTSLGYGCDLEVLQPYSSIVPVQAEFEALSTLIDKRNEFITQALPIKDQRLRLDAFMHKEPIDVKNFATALTREHTEVVSCIDSPAAQNASTATNTVIWNPLYFAGATVAERRGPFSFTVNLPAISNLFVRQSLYYEQIRSLPDYLKKPVQLQVDDTLFNALGFAAKGIFSHSLQNVFRPLVQSFMQRQALESASMRGIMLDNSQDMQQVFTPMRETIKKLSQSVSKKDQGARKFSISFAWFLRRSCIERPCNTSLDTVLKLLLTDECFPYANGEFKKADAPEACKTAADL